MVLTIAFDILMYEWYRQIINILITNGNCWLLIILGQNKVASLYFISISNGAFFLDNLHIFLQLLIWICFIFIIFFMLMSEIIPVYMLIALYLFH